MGIGVNTKRLCCAGLSVAALSCSLLTASAQSSVKFDLSGTWKTRFGPVTLVQDGESVTGNFVWREPGEFSGRIEGVWLSGRWQTSDRARTGTWRLEIMTGANRLVGKSIPDEGSGIVNFSAVREELLTQRPSRDIAPAPSNRVRAGVSGTWNASLGGFTLRQEGDLLTGLFDWDGGGRISGLLHGDILRGEWYGRDGLSAGSWHARLENQGRTLAGAWIRATGGVRHWTAERTQRDGEPGVHEYRSESEGRNDPGFTGRWRSRFGIFRLSEALQIISGRYEWDGGGILTGAVAGGTASGTWRSTDGSLAGTWNLRSLPGGRMLQGLLTTTEPEESAENWTAVRIE